MRKRDRDSISKTLNEIAQNINHFSIEQLLGSAWYFENNAEGKGIDFGYAALRNLEELRNQLNKSLERVHKNYVKQYMRRRSR